MGESLLELLSVILPLGLSVFGVLVSIKAPHERHHRFLYGLLIAAGVCVSGVTYWQQHMSRLAHASEVSSLNGRLDQLEREQQQEVARREQAENDLKIIVQASGKSTQDVLLSDIQQTSNSEAKRKSIREHLAIFLPEASRLYWDCFKVHGDQELHRTDHPLSDEQWAGCQRDKDQFDKRVESYIHANLDSSYLVRFKMDEEWEEWDALNQFLKDFTN